MIGNLLSGIICVITLLVCCIQSLNFEKNRIYQLILYSFILIMLRSLFPIREQLHINLLFAVVIYVSIPTLFFEGSTFSKFFFIIFYSLFSFLCELITMNFFSLFFHDKIISDNFAFILGLILTNLLLIIIMYIYSLYWKTFSIESIPKSSLLILCLPITTLILIVNLNDYIEVITNTNLFGITIIGLLFSNVVCIHIFYKTINTISNEKELKQMLEKTNLEYKTATSLLSQHNVFLHSIRNQSICMLSMLKDREYNKLENYINNIYGDSTNVFNMINTNCKIVDVLINDRIYIIKNNNIVLKTKLEDSDFNALNLIELEKIFKHIIDLAISECINSGLEKSYFYIKSKRIENQVILTFTFNSLSEVFDNKIDEDVKSILANHNSFYLIDYDENNNESSISILFTKGENS